MRIIVFSDSHGNYGALYTITQKHKEDGNLFLHLGDGEREFLKLSREFPELETRGVAGNCDWAATSERADLFRVGEKKFFMTHGHIYHVKSGLDELWETARGLGAAVALFGHTHTAHSCYRDGLYLFNPGSLCRSRGGSVSYGIVDLTGSGIVTNIVRL